MDDANVPSDGPAFFQVLLLNDDKTPMEFVVRLLETVFGKSPDEAVRLTLETHNKGRGVCGVFPHGQALDLIGKTAALAKRWNWPLTCALAPDVLGERQVVSPPRLALADGEEVILIGPMGAGKSTQGRLLAEALGLPQCSMDAVCWDYYREIGFDEDAQWEIAEKEGLADVTGYLKPFEAHAVERLLADHHGCVIDFGAGHSVFESDDLFARVRDALAPYPNVVLLLPTPDPDESIRILQIRRQAPPSPEFDALQSHFVKHPSNHDLAKIVVYTYGKMPEETRNEILAAIKCKARP